VVFRIANDAFALPRFGFYKPFIELRRDKVAVVVCSLFIAGMYHLPYHRFFVRRTAILHYRVRVGGSA